MGTLIKGDADKVYNGDLSGAGELSDAKLSKMAAKMDNVKKRLWALAENHSKRQGKKINGALLEKAYGDQLKRAINSDFKKMSAADRSRLAAISPAFIEGGLPVKTADVKEKGGASSSPSISNALSGGAGMASSGQLPIDTSGVDFLGSEEEETELPEVEGAMIEPSDKDVEDKAVHKGEQRSIWDILSIRYLKSFF